jgi:hypothetical protein
VLVHDWLGLTLRGLNLGNDFGVLHPMEDFGQILTVLDLSKLGVGWRLANEIGSVVIRG